MERKIYRNDGEQIIVEAIGDYVKLLASDGDIFQFPVREGTADVVAEGIAALLRCPFSK